MKLVNICMCIYTILKPYYFNKSGILQISDLFIVFAFILILVLKSKKRIESKNINKIKSLMLFVCLVLFINGIYFFVYGKIGFLVSSIQYIYLFIGIYVFYSILDYDNITNNICKIFKINIIIQLGIYLLGIGRDYYITRYMGTFNDPNQFAFYLFLTFMIIKVIDKMKNKNWMSYSFFWIVLFLIIKSVSTGMLLGMAVYVVLVILDKQKIILRYVKKHGKSVFIITMITIILVSSFFIIYNVNKKVRLFISSKIEQITNTLLFARIEEKIKKVTGNVGETLIESKTSNISFIEDRCLDKIVLYPEYMLFGAGQGYNERFDLANNYTLEIHSTLPSILFYYGVIPFVLLLYWICSNFKKMDFKQYIPYIAVLLESFTLLNQRQLFLWWMIILANNYMEIRNEEIKEKTDEV